MIISTVFFDVGGVLHKNSYECIEKDVATTFGLNLEYVKSVMKDLDQDLGTGRIDEKEHWCRFISQTGVDEKLLPRDSLLLRSYIKNFNPNNQVIELAKKLRERKYNVGIISNTCDPHAKYCKNYGLYEGFDPVILSNEVGLMKPGKEIYMFALNRAQIKPESSIFIDDSNANINSAIEVGIYGLVFKSYSKLISDLKSFGLVW